MGYFGGDWTHSEYSDVINKAKAAGNKAVSLDTEHCSAKSDELIKQWAEADGYKVTVNMDSVIVYLQ